MWKRLLACILACGVVHGSFDKLICKGRWVVDRLDRCPNHENYAYDVELHKKKVNRTHDGFYGEFNLLDDITAEDFGISIEACKQVIGGCRHVATFGDKDMCKFFYQYAEENFKRFLGNIGVEDHCPIPKGQYKLNDFLFDNTEIADDGMVGEFIATVIVTKHDEKLACIAIHLHFAERDADNE